MDTDKLKVVLSDMINEATDYEADGTIELQADVEHIKQIVEYLIHCKVNHGDSFDIPSTVKTLKLDILENHIT